MSLLLERLMEEKAELDISYKTVNEKVLTLDKTHADLKAAHEETIAQMNFLQEEKELASQDARRFQEGHKLQETINSQLSAKNAEMQSAVDMLTKQLGIQLSKTSSLY